MERIWVEKVENAYILSIPVVIPPQLDDDYIQFTVLKNETLEDLKIHILQEENSLNVSFKSHENKRVGKGTPMSVFERNGFKLMLNNMLFKVVFRQVGPIREITFDPHYLGFLCCKNRIIKVWPDSPAEAEGIRAGWIIKEINDRSPGTNTSRIVTTIKKLIEDEIPIKIKFSVKETTTKTASPKLTIPAKQKNNLDTEKLKNLAPGTIIQAQWDDTFFYNATIKQKTEIGYVVEYYEFGEQQEVPYDKIRLHAIRRRNTVSHQLMPPQQSVTRQRALSTIGNSAISTPALLPFHVARMDTIDFQNRRFSAQQLETIHITLHPGPIGISLKDNEITKVFPNSQAESKGIQVGYKIIEVNGLKQSTCNEKNCVGY